MNAYFAPICICVVCMLLCRYVLCISVCVSGVYVCVVRMYYCVNFCVWCVCCFSVYVVGHTYVFLYGVYVCVCVVVCV